LFGIGLAALLESPQITRLQRHPCNNATLLIDLGLPLGDVANSLGIVADYSTANALGDSSRLLAFVDFETKALRIILAC